VKLFDSETLKQGAVMHPYEDNPGFIYPDAEELTGFFKALKNQ